MARKQRVRVQKGVEALQAIIETRDNEMDKESRDKYE